MTLAVTDVGTGPAIVCLHAFPVNRHLWDGVAERLAAGGRRVIAPDLPGFGDSPLVTAEPDLAVAARAVCDTLRLLGVGTYTLAGISMGGYVTMQVLRQGCHPEPDSLVLLDTKMAADPEAARDNRLTVADRALAEDSTEFLVDTMINNLLGKATLAEKPDVVAQVSQWIRESSPEAVAWAQRAMAARPGSEDLLAGYPGRVLVLAGADDVVSPPDEQRVMASALRHGELRLLPDVGHLSAVEDPEAVADALLEFTTG